MRKAKKTKRVSFTPTTWIDLCKPWKISNDRRTEAKAVPGRNRPDPAPGV